MPLLVDWHLGLFQRVIDGEERNRVIASRRSRVIVRLRRTAKASVGTPQLYLESIIPEIFEKRLE